MTAPSATFAAADGARDAAIVAMWASEPPVCCAAAVLAAAGRRARAASAHADWRGAGILLTEFSTAPQIWWLARHAARRHAAALTLLRTGGRKEQTIVSIKFVGHETFRDAESLDPPAVPRGSSKRRLETDVPDRARRGGVSATALAHAGRLPRPVAARLRLLLRRAHARPLAAPPTTTAETAASRLAALRRVCEATFVRGEAAAAAALPAALDAITAADLGLAVAAQQQQQQQPGAWFSRLVGRGEPPLVPPAKPVVYLPIHSCGAYEVGVFCIRGGCGIPLHDHPGMRVWSRLVGGRLALRAFDWLPGGSAAAGGPASLAADAVLEGPAATRLLSATTANVHSLVALSDVAVLDVLSPPYDPAGGRDATYFEEEGDGAGGGRREQGGAAAVAQLRRLPRSPPGFAVTRGVYSGPAWRSLRVD